jgi:hypothetical protein
MLEARMVANRIQPVLAEAVVAESAGVVEPEREEFINFSRGS